MNDAKIDEFISLYIYEELYRDEEKIEVDEFVEDESKKEERVDLRDLPFCTIDPNSAKDHDDAIFLTKKIALFL